MKFWLINLLGVSGFVFLIAMASANIGLIPMWVVGGEWFSLSLLVMADVTLLATLATFSESWDSFYARQEKIHKRR